MVLAQNGALMVFTAAWMPKQQELLRVQQNSVQEFSDSTGRWVLVKFTFASIRDNFGEDRLAISQAAHCP